jgi:hypothetical protein
MGGAWDWIQKGISWTVATGTEYLPDFSFIPAAVEAVGPYAYRAALTLTKILAFEAALIGDTSSSLSTQSETLELTTYNPRLRGNTGYQNLTISTKARNLQIVGCTVGGGSYGLFPPENTFYTKCNPEGKNISLITSVDYGTPPRLEALINIETEGAGIIRYGSASGSSITLPIPYTTVETTSIFTVIPTCTTETRFNRPIKVSISPIGPSCRAFELFLYVNQTNYPYDPIKPNQTPNPTIVNISPLEADYPVPSTAFHNYEGVVMEYIVRDGMGGPLKPPFSFHSSTKKLTLRTSSGDQGSHSLLLTGREAANPNNNATIPWRFEIPDRAPYATGTFTGTGKVGVDLNFTLPFNWTNPLDPRNLFADPDNYAGSVNDIRTFSATGMPAGMSFNPSTLQFSWPSPKLGTYEIRVFAIDAAGIPSTPATVLVTIDSSLTYTPTTAPLICNQNGMCQVQNQNISTISSTVNIDYKIFDAAMGSFVCTSPGVTTIYNEATRTFTFSGTPAALNNASIFFIPTAGYKGAMGYNVKIRDGVNTAPDFDVVGQVEEIFIPPTNGTSSTASIERTVYATTTDTYTPPSPKNTNNYPITYDAFLEGGAALPSFISCNPATGVLTFAPRSGNQTTNATTGADNPHRIYIRGSTSATVNGTLYNSSFQTGPVVLSVPDRAPIASGQITPAIARYGEPHLTDLRKFIDPDGDPMQISVVSGQRGDMTVINGVLVWTPQRTDPDTIYVEVQATDPSRLSSAPQTLTINTRPSIEITLPSSVTALAENTGANTPQRLTLPIISSTFNGTFPLVYSASDPGAKLFFAPLPGVSITGNGTATVTISASVARFNQLSAVVVPSKYKRDFQLTVTGNNGAQPVDSSLAYPVPITPATVLEVNPGVAMSSTTAFIGQSSTLTVPSELINNPHNLVLNFAIDRIELNGTTLAATPSWLAFDPSTGRCTPAPPTGSGAQGIYTLYLKAFDSTNTTTAIALPSSLIVIPNRTPTATSQITPNAPPKYGEEMTADLSALIDADGDPVTISILNPTGNMRVNGTTLFWTPQAGDPSTVYTQLVARDHLGGISSAQTLTTTVQPSISFIPPAPTSLTAVTENTGANMRQTFTLPTVSSTFTGRYSLTYSSNAKLFLTATPGVSISGNGTTSVTVTATTSQHNQLSAAITPDLYARGSCTITVTGNNGAQPVDSSTTYALSIAPVTVLELNPGIAMANATAFIGQSNPTVSIPEGLINNPHNLPLNFAAKIYFNGTELASIPEWMNFNPSTGKFTPNPASGSRTQGIYTIQLEAYDTTNPSTRLSLPSSTITIPNRAPVVATPPAPRDLARNGVEIAVDLSEVFTDPDGSSDLTITSTGFTGNMRIEKRAGKDTFVWTPAGENSAVVTFIAKDELGLSSPPTTLTLNVFSSLTVTPPATSQPCLENAAYCHITLPTLTSPSTNPAVVQVSLTDKTKGSFVLNPDATGVTLTTGEDGIPTLRGTLSAIQAPNVLRFIPTTNTFGPVELNLRVVNDGVGNSQSLPTSFTINTQKIFIPIRAGNNPSSVTVSPTQNFAVTFPAVINPNRDQITYSARIVNSAKTTVFASSTDTTNSWQLRTANSGDAETALGSVPETMVPGNYIIELTTTQRTEDGTSTAVTVEAPFTIASTLQASEINSVASINVDSLTGGTDVLNVFQINYVGNDTSTVSLQISAGGAFKPSSYLDYNPTITGNRWSLTAPKGVLNWFLAHLPVELRPGASGQIQITGTVTTATETKTTPTIAIVPVVTVAPPPSLPAPNFIDTTPGKIVSAVASFLGTTAITILFLYLKGAWAARKEKAELRKIKELDASLAALHEEFSTIHGAPYTIEAMSRSLSEITAYNESSISEAAFARLEQFKNLSTAFLYANAKADVSISAEDQWKLLDTVIANLGSLKSSMQRKKPNYDFITYRLRLSRILLDMVFIDDTFKQARIAIDKKLEIIRLLKSLLEVKKIIDLSNPSDPEHSKKQEINAELQCLYAAITCMLDDDSIEKRRNRTSASIPPANLWYLKILAIERMLPYAIAAEAKKASGLARTAAIRTEEKADSNVTKIVEPLDELIKYYRDNKDHQTLVIARAEGALRKIQEQLAPILSAGPRAVAASTAPFISYEAAKKINDKITAALSTSSSRPKTMIVFMNPTATTGALRAQRTGGSARASVKSVLSSTPTSHARTSVRIGTDDPADSSTTLNPLRARSLLSSDHDTSGHSALTRGDSDKATFAAVMTSTRTTATAGAGTGLPKT